MVSGGAVIQFTINTEFTAPGIVEENFVNKCSNSTPSDGYDDDCRHLATRPEM